MAVGPRGHPNSNLPVWLPHDHPHPLPQDATLVYQQRADCLLALLSSHSNPWGQAETEADCVATLRWVYSALVCMLGAGPLASLMANPGLRPLRLQLQVGGALIHAVGDRGQLMSSCSG